MSSMIKRYDLSPNQPFQNQNSSSKLFTNLCSLISSGSTEDLEKFLSKHENLNYDLIAKAIFTTIKERKISVSQKEILQILFRFNLILIYISFKIFLCKKPISNSELKRRARFFQY